MQSEQNWLFLKKKQQLIESNERQLVLIKELHHRVKNNLQILNSFLSLEKRAYKSCPDVIVDHMQARLTSLALLHEETYNSSDFSNINLGECLSNQDTNTKRLVHSPMGIEFETSVDEDINLSIEVITPLLLIIDELTMIGIRNALPDDTTANKKITKKVTKLDNDTAVLTFEVIVPSNCFVKLFIISHPMVSVMSSKPESSTAKKAAAVAMTTGTILWIPPKASTEKIQAVMGILEVAPKKDAIPRTTINTYCSGSIQPKASRQSAAKEPMRAPKARVGKKIPPVAPAVLEMTMSIIRTRKVKRSRYQTE